MKRFLRYRQMRGRDFTETVVDIFALHLEPCSLMQLESSMRSLSKRSTARQADVERPWCSGPSLFSRGGRLLAIFTGTY